MKRRAQGTTNQACREYAVDLSAYFDGELEEPERAELEAHLADCQGCRHDLEKMGRLRQAMTAMRPPRQQRSGRLLRDLMRSLDEAGERGEAPAPGERRDLFTS